jgi:hypothetical protein
MPATATATAGDHKAVVSWTAPISVGAGAITGYSVTSVPGGKTCTTTGALTCTVTGLTNGSSYTFAVSAKNAYGSGPAFVTGSVMPLPPLTTYHPLSSPARLLDTRSGNGLSGKLSANVYKTFQVTGRGGVPANATAVTGNLTVTEQSAGGYLFIGPDGTNTPNSSTLNFPAGDNRANSVTVGLGSSGTLSLTYAAPGGSTTAAIFDVTGYFTPDMTGDTFNMITPVRLLDTRSGNGYSGKIAGGSWLTVQIGGRGVVPANAVAVTGNLTVTEQTSLGYLYVAPTRGAVSSSTLNFPVGDNRANAVTVGLSTAGTSGATGTCATTKGCLSIYYGAPSSARTHVIFDVTGFFMSDGTGYRYAPVTPVRLLDTRTSNGFAGPLLANTATSFLVLGRGEVPLTAVAVTGNLTVTQQSRLGYFFIGPIGASSPSSSTLNFPVGDNRANAVTVGLSGTGMLWLTYAAPSGSTTEAIFDVTGYFVP